MTVKELIEKLLQHDLDTPVTVGCHEIDDVVEWWRDPRGCPGYTASPDNTHNQLVLDIDTISD